MKDMVLFSLREFIGVILGFQDVLCVALRRRDKGKKVKLLDFENF